MAPGLSIAFGSGSPKRRRRPSSKQEGLMGIRNKLRFTKQCFWCINDRGFNAKEGLGVDIFEVVTGRRSIRKYKDTPVERAQIKQLLNLARLAPVWGAPC